MYSYVRLMIYISTYTEYRFDFFLCDLLQKYLWQVLVCLVLIPLYYVSCDLIYVYSYV